MSPITQLRSKSNLALPLFLVSFILFSASCNSKKKIREINPEFSKYIEAYTTGSISKTSVITIKLNDDLGLSHTLNEPINEKLFSFTPSISGVTLWTDQRTIEFRPSSALKSGELYTAEFNLGKIIKVPAEFKTFIFNFKVLNPSFTVLNMGLRTEGNSKDKMYYTGVIETADVEDSSAVKKLVSVKYNGANVNLNWLHETSAKKHTFTADGISRSASATELEVSWDGKAINSKESGKETVTVPAIGDFMVMSVVAHSEPENYASVQFSAPISLKQDLTGLITLTPAVLTSFSISGSEVKIFTDEPLSGTYNINVNKGIESIWGDKLNRPYMKSLFFENRKPSVTIVGQGQILPSSGNVVLPFDAVNLRAVDVTIIRIYESNIPQFLQTNSLNGYNYLRRVGKPVVQKTIYLDHDKTLNLSRRNRFSLDIDQLVKTEPGAMYRITIGFKPEYSLFACSEEIGSGQESSDDDDYWYYDDYYYGDYEGYWSDEDDEFWSMYDEYYPYGYDWKERNNPCHPSYYNKERWESRNIMASNLGLTVKRGNDKSLTVAVNDLISTDPLQGVQLELLDYQQQIMAKATTDNNGLATFEIKRKPFLLVAKRNRERGYLKLDDGGSLMMSRFEISGQEVQDGIKGFIFGERGVWRPGDSMYVSFILEDKDGGIPDDHPVEFTLITPRSQVYKKMVTTANVNGYYVFRTATDPSAPTGNWTAKVRVGGAVFEKRIKVETVMPNRLKIDLNFGGVKLLGAGGGDAVSLTSNWLFGAPAKNLKAKVDAALTSQVTSFENFKEYIFDDPTIKYSSQFTTVYDGKLDEEGRANFNLALDDLNNAPGMLRANFTVKVFEPGGAYSIDNMTFPYSPFNSYVGIKVPKGQEPFNYLLTGSQYTVDIVAVDAKGSKLRDSREVTAEMYQVNWKWWWDGSGDDLSNYTTSRYSKLIKSTKISLNNGSGKWTVKAPDDGYGRYLLVVHDKVSGHSTGKIVYFDDPYWQTRSRSGAGESATMLSFSTDKTKYNVGEKVKLTIPSSEGGRLLISIENGRKVVKTYWIKTEQGQTKFEFTAEAGMAPNIYVNVSMLQKHSNTLNDLPMRMYGVIPVTVEDQNTVLKPRIEMPDVIRPEQNVSMTVSEETGKDMTYTIAIVDEGLLSLTKYKTPDPHSHFYSKEALGVKTWDMYDNVIGAWGGYLGRILTVGGDEELNRDKQRGANRFKPVVQFFGPFQLGKNSRKEHNFKLPSYIGEVRVMVVAGQDAAYGSAEKSVTVRNPLMMLTTLPRAIAPNEEISIPVTVFAAEKHVKNVQVEVQSNPMLEIIGDRKKTLNFNTPGEETVYFNAKVKPNTGSTRIKVISGSGQEKASNEIEIEIRNPNPPVTKVEAKILQPGETWTITASPVGVPANCTAAMEVSSSPSVNLQKRLNYLISYPHGCIEQITSSAFPQIVLGDFIELNESRKSQIQRNVNAAIRRIYNQQNPSGGFSYWPGDAGANDWASSYAGHFLLEAKARGYSVSDDVLQSWMRYQKNAANRWSPSYETLRMNYDLAQAYRLYTLALAQAPELGAMNRLKEFQYISPEARWRLAMAYQLAGQNQVAQTMIKGLRTNFDTQATDYYSLTFGSWERDQAMVLEALTLLGKRKEAGELVQRLASKLGSEQYMSTQTTAYCLLAIAKFNGSAAGSERINASLTAAQKTSAINSTAVVAVEEISAIRNGNVSITLKNNGQNVLYARLITEGRPLPGDEIPAVSNTGRLKMDIAYLSFDGKSIDISSLTQGTDFVARVTINHPGGYPNYNELALSHAFPGGWEIMNTRIWDENSPFRSSSYDYQDVRDDRVYTYFDINKGTSKTYYVMLNAAYLGRYYLPMVLCEAMYDNNVSASVSGKWIEVGR